MRRNDLEILRRLPKEDGGGGKETDDEAAESQLVLPRDRCLQVVRGLMSLLLSMDFSCHVDLFLVACKVRVMLFSMHCYNGSKDVKSRI